MRVCFFFASAFLFSYDAFACDRLASTSLFFTVFPGDGARDVPTNATPIVSTDADGLHASVRLEEGEGVVVDVEVDAITLSGEFQNEVSEGFLRLRPTAPLAPQTTYTLLDDAGVIAAFTTGDVADTSPPLAPVVAVETVTQPNEDDTGFECSFDGTAVLNVESVDGQLVIAAYDNAPSFSSTWQGASTTNTLTVWGDGPRQAHVSFVDAAGNIGPSTIVELDIPPASCGCSAAGEADVAFSAFAFVFFSTWRSGRRRASAP